LIDTFGATPVGAVSPGAPSIGVNCTEPLSTLFSATNADLQACMDQAAASNGWLLANDVTGTFTCDNMSNGDLTGLEYLVNLTGFQANNSNITDADSATLAQLPNLTSLSLQNNNINDLSFLTVLTGLTALWLENNNVTDISALQNTSLLQTLSLANNVGISDFSALNSLDLLTDLNLENTGIGDLSVLINKPLVTLNLNSNQLQDLTLLGTLISLQTLQLANNQITDVNPLTGLVNLITLDLQNNQIGDGVQGYVDQLSALTSAISIDLTNNLTMSCGELKMLLNSPISANVTPSTVVSNPINPNVNCTELPADFSTTTVVISPLNPETHRYVYMTVNAKDIYGNNKTRGGDIVVVTALAGGVNFANDVGFIVTNNGDGTYSAKYAPYYYGDDNFYITINNDAVNGDNKNGQYTVHANDPPGVGIGIFGPSETIAVGDTINMTANGSDAEDPNNLTYYWDFGGPGNGIYDSNNNEIQFSTAKDPGYLTYTKTGTFPVTVTVTDPNGSTDSDSKKIVVANTWGTPEQLSTGSASSNPNIAIDGAGNMIAVWSERTQQFTTSIFAKRFQPVTGWDAPVVVEDVLANSYSNQPKIAMASSGYTIVVWKRLDGVSSIGRLWSNRYDPLDPINSWGIAQQVEQGVDNVLTLDMAQNNLGDAVVVWGERGATEDFIGARHYDRGTETWIGAPTPLATTATGHTFNWPRVTISPDSNEAYALWGDKASIGDIFGSASLAAGVWGPLQLLENDAGDAANPQISTLSNGNRFAVWSQVINYRSTIFSSEYSAGSWSTPQQVETNTAAGAAVEPHIAVDNSDNVIAIWRQGGHLWSALHDLNTSNWSLPQIISNQDVGQVGGDAVTYDNKVLAVNSSGDAIAVFYDGGDLWANNFNNGSGWGEPRLLESIPSGEFTIANQPALVIDSAGVGTVVWYQSVDIWVSRLQ
jgi:hypothetical protein